MLQGLRVEHGLFYSRVLQNGFEQRQNPRRLQPRGQQGSTREGDLELRGPVHGQRQPLAHYDGQAFGIIQFFAQGGYARFILDASRLARRYGRGGGGGRLPATVCHTARQRTQLQFMQQGQRVQQGGRPKGPVFKVCIYGSLRIDQAQLVAEPGGVPAAFQLGL